MGKSDLKSKDIQTKIDGLSNGIVQATRFVSKLNKERSDLLHYVTIADQNIKYLKKRGVAVIAQEFSKVLKSKKSAQKKIKDTEEEIRSLTLGTEKMKKEVIKLNKELSLVLSQENPKVLPFRRKGSK